MKKTVLYLLIALALFSCLAACAPTGDDTSPPPISESAAPPEASESAGPSSEEASAPAAQEVLISVEYVTDALLSQYESFEEFVEDESFGRVLLISTSAAIKDFKFTEVSVEIGAAGEMNYSESRVCYTLAELLPEKPLVIVGPIEIGTFTKKGISFVDETRTTRHFCISVSGEDGSLSLTEF
ncbi:MAG: hypothetical protein LBL15_01450 [Oscillospiraceae bacterium]|nr:hypothetical protein [Oscillospiraceae bacterium]